MEKARKRGDQLRKLVEQRGAAWGDMLEQQTAKLRSDLAARASDLGSVAEGVAHDTRKRVKALTG